MNASRCSVGDEVLHLGQGGELGLGRRPGELDLDAVDGALAERGHVLDGDQASLADEGDALADALHLGEHVRREEDGLAPVARFVDHAVELALHERVEPAGGLVEDQQLGLVHEGLDQAELALVAGREVAGAAREVEVEALGERLDLRRRDAAAQVAPVAQGLLAGQPRVERVLAGQVAHAAADGDAVAARVEAEDLRLARRRPDQVEQEADGRRLAGAVGPEKAEHGAAPRP